MIGDEEFVALAQKLSPAELRDWIGVRVLEYGVREWSREISTDDRSVPHQSVSRNVRNARRKLEESTIMEKTDVYDGEKQYTHTDIPDQFVETIHQEHRAGEHTCEGAYLGCLLCQEEIPDDAPRFKDYDTKDNDR